MSLGYYDDQAVHFFAETVEADITSLRTGFIDHLSPGATILDAGCGSGRDVKAFRNLGYAVTAIEPAPSLARMAVVHCGQPVEICHVQDIDWCECLDSIWACAILLQVPMLDLPDVMARLAGP